MVLENSDDGETPHPSMFWEMASHKGPPSTCNLNLTLISDSFIDLWPSQPLILQIPNLCLRNDELNGLVSTDQCANSTCPNSSQALLPYRTLNFIQPQARSRTASLRAPDCQGEGLNCVPLKRYGDLRIPSSSECDLN